MKTISQPTEALICEECGLRRRDWTGNNGRGIRMHGVLACCAGCCDGVGCTCKETGVRRVVVVRNEENQRTYVGKMGRQIREWQSRLTELEKRAHARGAEGNLALKRQMQDLRKRMEKSKSDVLEVGNGRKGWAQKTKLASDGYRHLKAEVEDLGRRIKKK